MPSSLPFSLLSGRWKAQLFFSGKISSSRPFPSMESASHAADLLIYCSHLLKHGGGKGGNLAAAVPPANTNHPLGADVKAHLAKMSLDQVGQGRGGEARAATWRRWCPRPTPTTRSVLT